LTIFFYLTHKCLSKIINLTKKPSLNQNIWNYHLVPDRYTTIIDAISNANLQKEDQLQLNQDLEPQ